VSSTQKQTSKSFYACQEATRGWRKMCLFFYEAGINILGRILYPF
jgi:hypothetical protein